MVNTVNGWAVKIPKWLSKKLAAYLKTSIVVCVGGFLVGVACIIGKIPLLFFCFVIEYQILQCRYCYCIRIKYSTNVAGKRGGEGKCVVSALNVRAKELRTIIIFVICNFGNEYIQSHFKQ